MKAHSLQRRGFTLIELLVSISIMIVLMSLVVAGVHRARTALMAKNTDQTVVKLQSSLDTQWGSVTAKVQTDMARRQIPQVVVDGCNGDLDLAAATWAYMQTRWEFPNTFTEAGAAVVGPGGYTLSPRSTFTSVVPVATSLNSQEQAAVLLYLILSNKSSGGTQFNADDATTGAQGTLTDTITPRTFKVFVDAYGTPITFLRYANGGFNGELSAKPYIDPNAVSKDVLDPRGRILSWTDTTAKAALQGNVFPTTLPGSATAFDGTNRQLAVIAAGYDRNFNLAGPGGIFGSDNHVGYRLRRQGARGD